MSKIEQSLKRKYRKIGEERNISVIFPKDNPGIAIKDGSYEARLNVIGKNNVSYGNLIGKRNGTIMSTIGTGLWEKIDIVLSYWKEYAYLLHFDILVLDSERDFHGFFYKNYLKPIGFFMEPPTSFSNYDKSFVRELFPIIIKEAQKGIFGQNKEFVFLPYLELKPGKMEQLFEQRISFHNMLKEHKKEDTLFATSVVKEECFSLVLLGNNVQVKWIIRNGGNALISLKTGNTVVQMDENTTADEMKEQFLAFKEQYIKNSRLHHLYDPNPFHVKRFFQKYISAYEYNDASMVVFRELSSFYTYNEIELFFADKENRKNEPVRFQSFEESYFIFSVLEKQIVLFSYKESEEKTGWRCISFSNKEERRTWVSKHINQNMKNTLSVI